jgi:hypothetical protein
MHEIYEKCALWIIQMDMETFDFVLRLPLLLFTVVASNVYPSSTFVFLTCVWFEG